MRYHYERSQIYRSAYRLTYECNHPVYDRCTLFKIDTKHTYWTEIDPWLTDMLYLNPKFKKYFDEMLALKIKPITKKRGKPALIEEKSDSLNLHLLL